MTSATLQILLFLTMTGIQSMTEAFTTPIPSLLSKPSIHHSQPSNPIKTKTIFHADANDDNEGSMEGETPATPPPLPPQPVQPVQPLDPLIASLTSPAPEPQEGAKTKSVPFFGEVSVDGGLLVLLPAAGTAVIGLILSIVVGFNARDDIVDTLEKVNPPPPKKVVVTNTCRGICSTQDDDLNSMRSFMEKLSSRKVSDVSFVEKEEPPAPEEPAPVVDEAAPTAAASTEE